MKKKLEKICGYCDKPIHVNIKEGKYQSYLTVFLKSHKPSGKQYIRKENFHYVPCSREAFYKNGFLVRVK